MTQKKEGSVALEVLTTPLRRHSVSETVTPKRRSAASLGDEVEAESLSCEPETSRECSVSASAFAKRPKLNYVSESFFLIFLSSF